jgi:hypothetical protein
MSNELLFNLISRVASIGITQEKELRNSVVELMRESGVRVSAKGSVVGSPLDVSLVCSVLKGIGLCFDTDTTDAATSSDTSSYITDSRTPESSSSVSPDATAVQDGILQHLKRKWEGVIETYTQKRIIATRTQSPGAWLVVITPSHTVR